MLQETRKRGAGDVDKRCLETSTAILPRTARFGLRRPERSYWLAAGDYGISVLLYYVAFVFPRTSVGSFET